MLSPPTSNSPRRAGQHDATATRARRLCAAARAACETSTGRAARDGPRRQRAAFNAVEGPRTEAARLDRQRSTARSVSVRPSDDAAAVQLSSSTAITGQPLRTVTRYRGREADQMQQIDNGKDVTSETRSRERRRERTWLADASGTLALARANRLELGVHLARRRTHDQRHDGVARNLDVLEAAEDVDLTAQGVRNCTAGCRR